MTGGGRRCRTCSWRWSWPDGTRLALAADLAGLDAIVADEFADLAAAGDFQLGAGYLAVLRAYAARLRGRSADALRTSLGACAVLTTSRVFASLAHAERAQAAALRGEPGCAREAMAESDRAHAPAVEMLYPWLEQARAAVAAGDGDLTGAPHHLGALVRGCATTASPGTRCSPCTTWSGWTGPGPRSGWPATVAHGRAPRSA